MSNQMPFVSEPTEHNQVLARMFYENIATAEERDLINDIISMIFTTGKPLVGNRIVVFQSNSFGATREKGFMHHVKAIQFFGYIGMNVSANSKFLALGGPLADTEEIFNKLKEDQTSGE